MSARLLSQLGEILTLTAGVLGFKSRPTFNGKIPFDTGNAYSPNAGSPVSEIVVTGSSGGGTTNTATHKFTTVESSVGTDITYVNSASLGDSFVVNTPGMYFMSFEFNNANPLWVGISRNATDLGTTVIQNFTAVATRLAMVVTSPVNGNAWTEACTAFRACKTGDVIRCHMPASTAGATPAYVKFTIARAA